MEVERSLSVDELYERVKDYDLVFTAEASLADALNNRLEEPVLGHFATTPMLYVLSDYQNKKLAKERELFIETVKQTGFSWKKASYLVGNIVDCWTETGDPESILEYDRFSSEELEKVLDIVEGTENVYSSMMEADVDEDDVAVINPHQMSELDRAVLPEDFDQIDTFTDERKELSDFKLYNSTSEIVNELRQNISQEDADDVAIVADPDSEYTVLAKTALEEEGIPYLSQRKFRDGESLRTFVRFLRLGLTEERLLVKDCRGVMRSLGFEVPRKYQNDYLQQTEKLEEFRDLLNSVSGSRLSYILDRFEEKNGDMNEVRQMLEELDLLAERVDHETLSRLEYYLDSYEIDSETKGEGVLFVSPRSQAYVDKPIVFFLGMDSSWTAEVGDEPWINRDSKEKTNLKNFKSLIQSGEQQHYLVKNSKLNHEITPCLYFSELIEFVGDLEAFSSC